MGSVLFYSLLIYTLYIKFIQCELSVFLFFTFCVQARFDSQNCFKPTFFTILSYKYFFLNTLIQKQYLAVVFRGFKKTSELGQTFTIKTLDQQIIVHLAHEQENLGVEVSNLGKLHYFKRGPFLCPSIDQMGLPGKLLTKAHN